MLEHGKGEQNTSNYCTGRKHLPADLNACCPHAQRLGRRLWKQRGAAPLPPEPEADDVGSAAAASAQQPRPLPALLPPFVVSHAAARLCPPRVSSDRMALPLQSQQGSFLLGGWHLLMPQRWSGAHARQNVYNDATYFEPSHRPVLSCWDTLQCRMHTTA